MITKILLFIACVVYNEANIDFTDDLDYAGVSGMFVPINTNLNYEASDELSARQYNVQRTDNNENIWGKIRSAFGFYDMIKNAYEKRKTELELYHNCVVDILFEEKKKKTELKAEDKKCPNGINLFTVLSKISNTIKIDDLSSGFIQSKILFVKLLSIDNNYVSIDTTYKGDSNYTHTQSMLNLKNVNVQLKIRRKRLSVSFTLKGELNNLKTEIEYNGAESPIAKVTVTVEETTIQSFFESWHLTSADFVDNAFPFEMLKNSQISGNVKALYNTTARHFQLLAQLKYTDNQIKKGLSINVIIDKPGPKDKPKREYVAVALVATLGSADDIMGELLKKFNYEGPNFIKDLIKSGTLSISKHKIDLIEHEGFLKLDGKVQKSVEEGINIYIETQMKKSLEECANRKSSSSSSSKFNRSIPEKKSNGRNARGRYNGGQNSSQRFPQNRNNNANHQFQTPTRAPNFSQRIPQNRNNNANHQFQTPTRAPSSPQHSPQRIAMTKDYENLVKISIVSKVFTIKLPKSFSEDLTLLLKCFLKEAESTAQVIDGLLSIVPEFIRQISFKDKFHISELSFTKEEYKITMQYTEEIIAPFNLVIKSPTFEVLFIKTNKTLMFNGRADVYFQWNSNIHGEMAFTIDTSSNIAFDTRISITDISKFTSKIEDTNLKTYIPKFNDIALKEVIISGNLNLKKMEGQLILSASTCIYNIKNATLTFFIWNNKKFGIAIGLIMKNQDLSKALNQFAKMDDQDSWFSDTNIVMILSIADKDNKPEEVKQLKDQAHSDTINELINKMDGGFQIEASYEFKENGSWKKNAVLNYLGEHKVKNISLKGKIDLSGFNIEAHIETDIVLHEGSGFTLKNISLVITFQWKRRKLILEGKKEVFLMASFKIDDPSLIIKGSVGISKSGGLEFVASMKGMVHNPFGWSWFSIGNLHAHIFIKSVSFTVGAEVWFGKIPSSQDNLVEIPTQGLFKFSGFFGFSFTKNGLLKWFISFKRTGDNFTIGTILKAFGFERDLPNFIANNGFIGETKVSISLKEQEVRDFDVTVPEGLYLKGCLSIFDYRVAFEISISLTKFNFEFKGWFDPISLGGLKLYRSQSLPAEGPILKVHVNSEVVEVYIEAYLSIYGFESGVKIKINKTRLYFETHNNLFGVLKTNLKVQANYDGGLKNFHISGSVESEVLTGVTSYLKKTFRDAVERVEKIYENAMDISQHIIIFGTNTILEKIKSWIQKLQAKQNQLEREEAAILAKITENEKNYRECLSNCAVKEKKSLYLKITGMFKENWCIGECKLKITANKFSTTVHSLANQVIKTLPAFALSALSALKLIFEGAQNMITRYKDLSEAAFTFEKGFYERKYSKLPLCEVKQILVQSEVHNENIPLDMSFKAVCGPKTHSKKLNVPYLANDGISFLGKKYAEIIEPKVKNLKEIERESINEKEKFENERNTLKKNLIETVDNVKQKLGIDLLNGEKIDFEKNVETVESLFQRSAFFPIEYLDIKDNATRVTNYFTNTQEYQESAFCQQHQNVLSRYRTLANAFSLPLYTENDIDTSEISSLNQIDRSNGLNHSLHIKDSINKTVSNLPMIDYVRKGINYAVESERGMKLPEYIKYLDSIAVQANEKFYINKNQHTNNFLHDIKEILLNVATNENIPSKELAKSIGKVQQMLSDMEISSIQCAA